MTKDEALRLALEYVELVPDDRYNAEHIDQDALITAIKAALEAKDEPAPVAKNEGGRITWMIDDWPQNCLLYTHLPKQEAKDEPWEKFCDSHCVWTDHHPDCKLAKDEPVAYVETKEVHGHMCNFIYRTDSTKLLPDGAKLYITPPQRKPLTDEEIHQIFIANSVVVDNGNAYMVAGLRTVNITRAIEAKLKEKNT